LIGIEATKLIEFVSENSKKSLNIYHIKKG